MSLAGGPGKQHEQVQSSLGRVNNLLYMQFIPLLWLWKALKIEVQWILKKNGSLSDTKHDISPTITNKILFGCFDPVCVTHLPA